MCIRDRWWRDCAAKDDGDIAKPFSITSNRTEKHRISLRQVRTRRDRKISKCLVKETRIDNIIYTVKNTDWRRTVYLARRYDGR